MTLATLADAPEFKLGALRIRSLAVPSRGTKQLTTWRVDLPAGSTSGPHALDQEQVIVVGEGSVTAAIGGTTMTANAGDALILPANTTIEMSNPGSSPAMATVISPAGFRATAGGNTFAPPWSI